MNANDEKLREVVSNFIGKTCLKTIEIIIYNMRMSNTNTISIDELDTLAHKIVRTYELTDKDIESLNVDEAYKTLLDST